jgi:hypothetical protein
MPKYNDTLTDVNYFEVDDIPYQKGMFLSVIDTDNEQVGIYAKDTVNGYGRNQIVDSQHYSNWTDQSGTPFASFQDLVNALKANFFF